MKLSQIGAVFLCTMFSLGSAAAHPHMFVDANAELTANEKGQLVGVRIFMQIDELTTLYVLQENGISNVAQPLSAEKSATIGATMADALGHYGHFTDLSLGGERLKFASAKAQDLRLEGAKLTVTLVLELETPQDVGDLDVALSLYDPTYFAAVETTKAPALPPQLKHCTATLIDFKPTSLNALTLAELAALSREETPTDPEIGAQLADRSYVTCNA